MRPHLHGLFDQARFWQRKKAASIQIPSASQPTTSTSSAKGAVVFYDANLNIVTREEAVYELRFANTFGLQWRLVKGAPNAVAPFSIWAYTVDWDAEKWTNYPANVIAELIPQLLRDPQSSCHTAFQWVHQDWSSRIRPFLATHRGSPGDCERMLIWLAWNFILPEQSEAPPSSWTIAVRQDDAQAINLALWSHVKRDCVLLAGDEAVQMSDEQLKLLRIVHCYFLPFYLENMRRYHPCASQLWKDGAIRWQIDVPSPSHHERLEARLHLRQWLQNKVPPDELASLLK